VIHYSSFENFLKECEGKTPAQIFEASEFGREMALLSRKLRLCRKHYALVSPTLVAMGKDRYVSILESRLFDRCEVCGAPAWKTIFIRNSELKARK